VSTARRARRFGAVEVVRAATQLWGEDAARTLLHRLQRNGLSQAAEAALYALRDAEKAGDAWRIAEARAACDKAHRYLAAHEAWDVASESEAA